MRGKKNEAASRDCLLFRRQLFLSFSSLPLVHAAISPRGRAWRGETVVDDEEDLPAEGCKAIPGTGDDTELIYWCLVKTQGSCVKGITWTL